MGKFGWSYPAGCDGPPESDYDDSLCAQCGDKLIGWPDLDPESLAFNGFCCEECKAAYEAKSPSLTRPSRLASGIINNEADMLAHLEAKDRDQAKRHVYKYTECGAWIKFKEDGIEVGSIVEGCHFGTAVYPLKYPFTPADYDARIEAVETEADDLWKWANEGPEDSDTSWAEEGLDAPDTHQEFKHLGPHGRSA